MGGSVHPQPGVSGDRWNDGDEVAPSAHCPYGVKESVEPDPRLPVRSIAENACEHGGMPPGRRMVVTGNSHDPRGAMLWFSSDDARFAFSGRAGGVAQ